MRTRYHVAGNTFFNRSKAKTHLIRLKMLGHEHAVLTTTKLRARTC